MKNILVVSHERSGTHFLIDTIANCFGKSNKKIDLPLWSNNPKVCNLDEYRKLVESFIEKWSKERTDRIFKSHHDVRMFENVWGLLVENFHIVYISRNYLDTFTSCYHYFNKAPSHFPKFNSFLEFIETKPYQYGFNNDYSYEKYDSFIDRWYQHNHLWYQKKDSLCWISYEELSEDFIGTTKRLGEYLGETPSSIEKPNLTGICPRKGIVGDWKTLISSQQVKLINDRLYDLKKKHGNE